MKDKALMLAASASTPAMKLNVLREYLQAMVLRSLHEEEAFRSISFVGGTALRFLFGMRRFSEDLDFSMESPEGYAFEGWMRKVKRDFALSGFDVTVKIKKENTVNVAWIKTRGILKEAGLSQLPDQNLSIKVDVDTKPPAGAVSRTQLVRRHLTFALRHHELPSLMAGKLHALITRAYAKGRDWYDLVWYLTHRPPLQPNEILLQNALDQTEGKGRFDSARWREHVWDRLQQIDWGKIGPDVVNFLESPQEAQLLTKENLESVLGARS
ncbi:MAG: nucleotidyl transferase AbiEii/AbiGii toxin family protein [Candidatus Omnitrophica bacterium]|nr:nucleotidyl transferase AbiEii/AbiGii toxin family protein [Candidatus Omnitrophota bacterium]